MTSVPTNQTYKNRTSLQRYLTYLNHRQGAGTRIPALVLSPYAKKGHVEPAAARPPAT